MGPQDTKLKRTQTNLKHGLMAADKGSLWLSIPAYFLLGADVVALLSGGACLTHLQ